MSLNGNACVEVVDLSDCKIQFIGKIDGEIFIMSLPEADDGEEICEFPGYQFVLNALSG